MVKYKKGDKIWLSITEWYRGGPLQYCGECLYCGPAFISGYSFEENEYGISFPIDIFISVNGYNGGIPLFMDTGFTEKHSSLI